MLFSQLQDNFPLPANNDISATSWYSYSVSKPKTLSRVNRRSPFSAPVATRRISCKYRSEG